VPADAAGGAFYRQAEGIVMGDGLGVDGKGALAPRDAERHPQGGYVIHQCRRNVRSASVTVKK
jgi:hypothetical protein